MTQMVISKVNEEQRLVAGWASVVEENGKAVVDWQGDVISVEEIQKAAHGFMVDSRASLEMHKGSPVAMVVESLVFTNDIQKSLGVDLQKQGWFIVVKVLSDEVWAKVKSGELKAFSIGGFSADKQEIA